ncbi:hypothetical protein D9758_009957 [Tetrapyrgos nigripes]|uniref:Cation/H+ exchanger transmembrane domain-containing protein n=1 Tax=Tetrapyrgos nigripes TaxID=182062 RepID=A0A8H5CS81_9AGAR|nr:hypothetical protein D9758_009957 [Tetrapyrgos nigripes]
MTVPFQAEYKQEHTQPHLRLFTRCSFSEHPRCLPIFAPRVYLVPGSLDIYGPSLCIPPPLTLPSSATWVNTANSLRALLRDREAFFSGDNPADYNANDPIRLWVIQIIVIMAMTQVLAMIFGRIRQPRVIAEVIGGVFLGPTVMGRIHGFRQAIFPEAGMPLLNLTANIGLVVYLFIIALELDMKLIRKNVTASASISLAGLIVPLGLGAALGVGVYKEFADPSINQGYFILFVAVAIGITAFPVLCRILNELKLLDTTVGVVTLAAGVGNDVVGWILLALTVALVNADSGLTALWVLFTAVGYVIFLLVPVKWAYRWLAKKTGSLEMGTPSTFMMSITIVTVFFSAFFTDIIGVHAIFGGFLTGLIIPHDNGYAIAMAEKLEDLVTILFLPLYFTLSGLRTDLGQLDTGIAWGYTILIIVVALCSKFFACAITAKASGFNLRESGAIGSLMSCKGLVELIVLNVGFQAGVLNTKTFSMFVVHAILVTFLTTPLVLLFYPEKYRVHIAGAMSSSSEDGQRASMGEDGDGEYYIKKFMLVVDKLDQLPAAMTVTQLLCPTASACLPLNDQASSDVKDSVVHEKEISDDESTLSYDNKVESPLALSSPISLMLLRLIGSTTRDSDIMRSQETSALIHADPVVSVFRTFCWLVGGAAQRLKLKFGVNVVGSGEFDGVIARRAREEGSEMVVLPWSRSGGVPVPDNSLSVDDHSPSHTLANLQSTSETSCDVYSELVRKVFSTAPCDVALFVDRGPDAVSASDYGLAKAMGPGVILVLPFFGGLDDRLALKFVVRMCAGNEDVKALVVRIDSRSGKEGNVVDDDHVKQSAAPAVQNTISSTYDTVYEGQTTQTRLASETADNLLWERYTNPRQPNTRLLDSLPLYPKSPSARFPNLVPYKPQSTASPIQDLTPLPVEELSLSLADPGERETLRLKSYSKLPPGPHGLPLVGNVFQFDPVRAWHLCEEYKRKYGPIVYLNFFGQPVVVINTKKAAHDLLVHRAANYSDRARSIVEDYMTGGMNFVIIRYGELQVLYFSSILCTYSFPPLTPFRWRKFRRSSQFALSPKAIAQYQSLQQDEMVLMTYGMMHDPDHWTEEISRAMSSIVLSMIYDLPPVKSLSDPFVSKNREFARRLSEAFYPGAHLVELFPILDYLPAWLAKWKRDAIMDFRFFSALFQKMFRVNKEQVVSGEEHRASFCATIAENQEKMAISDLECAWLAGSLHGAAHNTTYTMITWAIFAMIHFPEAQRRAQQQLDEVVGRSRIPSLADFKHLPYIRAIVQEARLVFLCLASLTLDNFRYLDGDLLLHLDRRIVQSRSDDYYEGYYIPKGTFCMPNIRSMNYDSEIYGPDAGDFKPDRHLDSCGNIKDENDEGHFSYGFGYRDCVGRHLANNALFIAVSMLLWSMKIEPGKDENGKNVLPDINSEEMDGFMIRPAQFRVTLSPRFPDVEMILRQARDDVVSSERYKRSD